MNYQKYLDNKVKSLNGVFHIVDGVTDKLAVLTEAISDSVVNYVKENSLELDVKFSMLDGEKNVAKW